MCIRDINNIQIDGISFIEHISFKAFNEGVRLKDCIHLQQQLTGVRVKVLAADSIYANNANRKFCTKYHISTSFKRKGRAAKDEPLRKILRSELSRERATRLEDVYKRQLVADSDDRGFQSDRQMSDRALLCGNY